MEEQGLHEPRQGTNPYLKAPLARPPTPNLLFYYHYDLLLGRYRDEDNLSPPESQIKQLGFTRRISSVTMDLVQIVRQMRRKCLFMAYTK